MNKNINLKKDMNIISRGSTSECFTSPYIFVKYIKNYEKYNVYEREKYISSILNKYDWYPTLIYSDDVNKFLYLKM